MFDKKWQVIRGFLQAHSSIITLNNQKIKAVLKLVLKLSLTVLALYFVFQKIEFASIWEAVKKLKLLYLLPAILFFNVSKIVSAIRLNHLYRVAGLNLSEKYNLKLYYLGMFYNLFLPGSIGGDGYKVYLLRQSKQVKTRLLVAATLLDRLIGLAALLLLTLALFFISSFTSIPFSAPIALSGIVLVVPFAWLGFKWFFRSFLGKFWVTLHLSFWVQLSQIVSAMFLFFALAIDTYFADYLTLFLLSSIASVLPITVGGAGLRELVFLYGTQYSPINEPKAITFSLLFFAITAFSSLIGLFFSYMPSEASQAKQDVKKEEGISKLP